jgi:DNA-binding NtrC family response regulator
MSNDADVMVLDDESMVCERLREPLAEKGFNVETFTDSQSALERLAAKHFDVVVTDLKMKGPTGLDLLHHLRTEAPTTQVIIITGYATIESAREAEYGGVYGFVTKPFKIKELVAMVAKAARKAVRARGKEPQP